MAWPVFKTASETSCTAPVGSIPTRSRHLFRLAVPWAGAVLLLMAGMAPLAAQDSTAAPAPADTVLRHKPNATTTMLKSLVVPGWGQLSMGRELTALVFVAGEAGTLTMVIRSQHDLDAARAAGDSVQIDHFKQKREDWLVYMGLNHVLSALEAYVSAKLWDFPDGLDVQVMPGRLTAGARLPVRLP